MLTIVRDAGIERATNAPGSTGLAVVATGYCLGCAQTQRLTTISNHR
jgi:hypothetical protein